MAGSKIGVCGAGYSLLENLLNSFDLLAWNGNRLSLHGDEAGTASHALYRVAHFDTHGRV
jgi:hypothetical protein